MSGGLFIGLMSGTSADGIDAVLVQSDGERSTLLATQHRPMPSNCEKRFWPSDTLEIMNCIG